MLLLSELPLLRTEVPELPDLLLLPLLCTEVPELPDLLLLPELLTEGADCLGALAGSDLPTEEGCELLLPGDTEDGALRGADVLRSGVLRLTFLLLAGALCLRCGSLTLLAG